MQEFNKIKSARVGAGLTQEQMAEALGIATRTYQFKENGAADWKLSEMNKFAEIISNSTGQQYSVKDIFFQTTMSQFATKGDNMESVIEGIKQKLRCWSKSAWSNQDIMICLDVGETKASQLHQLAKRRNGIIKALKTKVKPESVCGLLGIDYNNEIAKLSQILKIMEENNNGSN